MELGANIDLENCSSCPFVQDCLAEIETDFNKRDMIRRSSILNPANQELYREQGDLTSKIEAETQKIVRAKEGCPGPKIDTQIGDSEREYIFCMSALSRGYNKPGDLPG